jgi:hypothetical protein
MSEKNPSQEKAGGVAQGVGPEFKPQYKKKKEKCEKIMCFKISELNCIIEIIETVLGFEFRASYLLGRLCVT